MERLAQSFNFVLYINRVGEWSIMITKSNKISPLELAIYGLGILGLGMTCHKSYDGGLDNSRLVSHNV